LSLPQVALAPEASARFPSTQRISGVYGLWEGEPVSISMWQSNSTDTKEEGA
jgi:chemotaxis protein CheX